jgi:hypothetical protein
VKNELTRRNLLGRAGIALGGAVALGALACGSDDSDPQPEPQPQEGPQVADFPYEKHLAADFQLNVDTVKEAAYQAYYAGGCCHGAYSALLGDLNRAGAPFTLLPLGFGKFGAGGVELYGSICGAALGGVLVLNMVVENPDHRRALVTELLRWYEGAAFPAYVPQALVAAETADATKPTLDFSAGNVVNLQVVPGSHLCHVSVSTWCAANGGVNAGGADKKARCARLTADVAGKTAELVNAYLVSGAYGARGFTGAAIDSGSGTCLACHGTKASMHPVVATGMSCTTCHPDQVNPHIPQ